MQRSDPLDRGNEDVAALPDSADVMRGLGVVAEMKSDLADRLVDSLFEIDIDLVAPERMPDFFAGNHFPGAADQQDQNAHRLPGKAKNEVRLLQLLEIRIELERAESEHFVCGAHAHIHEDGTK